MPEPMDRRRFIKRSALTGSGLVLGGVPVWADAARVKRATIPFASDGQFLEGVASGQPKPHGIVLWTRLGGQTGDRRLTLEVARERDFRRVVHRQEVVAPAGSDHTVKVGVAGLRKLRADEQYFYRFATRRTSSPVGRFKTLPPPDSRQPVRLVFWSCQDWQAGYYGAHRTIAALEDVDLVVCLGDYIYERNFYTGPQDRQDRLGANRDGEVQTLPEYRDKYRMYKSDADLRAMHLAHPHVMIWDDHEVEDNYTRDQPGAETMQVRVPFPQRKANGYRAFDEYLPQRFVGSGTTRLYRSFRIGRIAELFMLDQRQYRDDQPCGDMLFTPCPEAESVPRRYLGDEQKEWFKLGLRASGARWKLVANQLMIMSLDSPQGVPINKDSWDGYGAERREILSMVRDRGVQNIAFLTGDIHTFYAGNVGINGRGPDSVATEFVGSAISSLGFAEEVSAQARGGLTKDQIATIAENLPVTNPHLVFNDQRTRGYGLLTATDTELRVEFKAVDALTRNAPARTLKAFRVARGNPRVQVL